ncbi:hypothetical protein VNI00_006210 [Paramarasmius palmivorus]|uniref:Uncharacterized protein n=1 Tax=Paramarasmius palmivorus TaxID=297713 RepID=A0AAW0D8J7_9AGAR
MNTSLESIMDYSDIGERRVPALQDLEKRLGPLMLAENTPPAASQVNGWRLISPLYGLGWKFTSEEKLELAKLALAAEDVARNRDDLANALGDIWLKSELSTRYHWRDQPDYKNTGTVHGAVFVVRTNTKPMCSESFITEVMELYNIKKRPSWYIFADV